MYHNTLPGPTTRSAEYGTFTASSHLWSRDGWSSAEARRKSSGIVISGWPGKDRGSLVHGPNYLLNSYATPNIPPGRRKILQIRL